MAKNLLFGVNEIAEGPPAHALAFELHLVPGTGGEASSGAGHSAIDHYAELDAEARRVPAVVFAVSSLTLVDAGSESMPA